MEEWIRAQTTRWGATIDRHALPFGFAVLFWIVVLILVLFAVAAGVREGNPFTAFFAAFGAVGQVVFAFMVWRLGTRQFAFTQVVAERQLRVDTFEHRKRLYKRYNALSVKFTRKPHDDSIFGEFGELSSEIDQIFSDEVEHLTTLLIDALVAYGELMDEMETAEEWSDEAAVDELARKRPALSKEVYARKIALRRRMFEELRLR